MTTSDQKTCPQEWHRLTGASIDAHLAFQTRITDEAAGLLNPILRAHPTVGRAIQAGLDAHFDFAFQAGRDSRGSTPDEDRLWAVHVQGSDDIVAHPSRDSAQAFVDWADARDAENDASPHYVIRPGGERVQTDVYMRAYVVEWPFDPAGHAEGVAAMREEDEQWAGTPSIGGRREPGDPS